VATESAGKKRMESAMCRCIHTAVRTGTVNKGWVMGLRRMHLCERAFYTQGKQIWVCHGCIMGRSISIGLVAASVGVCTIWSEGFD
jgi:hypothetical protein